MICKHNQSGTCYCQDCTFEACSHLLCRFCEDPALDGTCTCKCYQPEKSAASDKKNKNIWDNDRGRGAYNRTYDASIPNRSIEPVNLIDREKIYEIIYKKYKLIVTEESSEGKFIDGTNGAKSYTITTHTQRTQEYFHNVLHLLP